MKQRLVGAAVLMALGVIFIPIFLAPEEPEISVDTSLKIDRSLNSDEFSSKVLPIEDNVLDSLREIEQRQPQIGERATLPPEVAATTEKDAGGTSVESRTQATTGQATERIGMTAWVVQAGSFSSKENAEKLVERLRTKAYSAYIDEIAGEKASFRVRIGPLLSKARAEQTASSLRKSLSIDGIVLKYQ